MGCEELVCNIMDQIMRCCLFFRIRNVSFEKIESDLHAIWDLTAMGVDAEPAMLEYCKDFILSGMNKQTAPTSSKLIRLILEDMGM